MVGFALGGYHDDTFYSKPTIDMIERLQLYRKSMTTEVGITPYMYPVYGLSSINEAFLRRVPLNQGKIELSKHISEFIVKNGTIQGIQTTDGKTYRAPIVICDPSAASNGGFKEHLYVKEKIVRCVCILNHSIEETLDRRGREWDSGLIHLANKTGDKRLNRDSSKIVPYARHIPAVPFQ